MTQTPEELGQKIKEAQERQERRTSSSGSGLSDNKSGAASAMRAGTDLVAALAVGGFLGYWIDRWLGTKPWMMIILFFLGFCAGFLNIYRSQTGQDYKIGFKDETKDKDNKGA